MACSMTQLSFSSLVFGGYTPVTCLQVQSYSTIWLSSCASIVPSSSRCHMVWETGSLMRSPWFARSLHVQVRLVTEPSWHAAECRGGSLRMNSLQSWPDPRTCRREWFRVHVPSPTSRHLQFTSLKTPTPTRAALITTMPALLAPRPNLVAPLATCRSISAFLAFSCLRPEAYV